MPLHLLRFCGAAVAATLLTTPSTGAPTAPPPGDAAVIALANEYERSQATRDDASGLIDNTPSVLESRSKVENYLAAQLREIKPVPSSATASLRAALAWRLETAQALRVCRSELWDLDHISGWQVIAPQRLATLRLGTPASRVVALTLPPALAAHLDQDIANLRLGLANGYSAPKSVVNRVIAEIDALLALPPERSPFFAAGPASKDPAFEVQWRSTVEGSLLPAIRRYRSFLKATYLPEARTSLGLSSLPKGKACYAAYLRQATTLDRSARQVFALGKQTVARSQRELSELGSRRFGLSDPAAVLARTEAEPSNHFTSVDELLAFSKAALARTVSMSAPLFERLPTQPIIVETMPAYQQEAGVPSHYEAQPDASKPAVFRISLSDWAHETVGAAEVTASHETVPGHHLQIATARQLHVASRFADIDFNSAYVEGWANYAEGLAEEVGIYRTDAAKVFRRAVLGRSLVVDPGIHVFGWPRDHARIYMMRAGLSAHGADDLIDRIAVQPAQLTSYESGGLEIYELREDARKRLGAKFSLSKFHQRVLERGVVTLNDLDQYVRRWNGD